MFLNLNTILREKVNDTVISFYDTPQIPIYKRSEHKTDSGPHCIYSVSIPRPEAQEIGYSASRSAECYIQFIVAFPSSSNGLDWAINNAVNELDIQYQRGDEVENGIGVEWLGVEKLDPIGTNGHETVTVRAHFRFFECSV